MHVDRFSVLGIGPVLLRLGTYKGTEFVISAIPFGAYVHIVGMEPEDDEDDEMATPPPVGFRNFRDSPVWARALAISGGPLFNYATAMIIIAGIIGFIGKNEPNSVAIGAFTPESPSQAACFEVGDTYVSIAGESVQGPQPDQRVREASLEHLGETIPIVVERQGEEIEFQMKLNETPPALGVGFAPEQNYIEVSPVDAIVEGVKWPLIQTQRQLAGLASMITGKSKGEVGGPSAIVKTIKGSVDSGLVAFLTMAALISTVLGLFNILPLPALDGGRLMFMFYEVIFRRPANKVVEGWVHGIGIMALLGFIGFVEVRAAARAVTDDSPSFLQRSPEIFDRAVECDSAATSPAKTAPAEEV
jgi:regulator of sigma E protease